ncbi:MAG: GAF domain-containing protein [Pseudomonadota bacterium]
MIDTNYDLLNQQAHALIATETDLLANLSNSAALLFHSLGDVNWAGFYLGRDPELILGPFQGQPACVRIEYGKGVCGAAAKSQEILRVDDVHEFPGHIACDAASNSEIVLPLLINGICYGVLDIDSPSSHRFTEADEAGLTKFRNILMAVIAESLAAYRPWSSD